MLRILVFDDLSLYCLGMKYALRNISDIQVAGEAYCEASLFEFLVQMSVDMVLLGVNMPDRTGCVLIAKRLRREYPAIKIILVADEDNAKVIQSILQVGIDGYIGKREAIGNALAKMVRKVLNIY